MCMYTAYSAATQDEIVVKMRLLENSAYKRGSLCMHSAGTLSAPTICAALQLFWLFNCVRKVTSHQLFFFFVHGWGHINMIYRAGRKKNYFEIFVTIYAVGAFRVCLLQPPSQSAKIALAKLTLWRIQFNLCSANSVWSVRCSRINFIGLLIAGCRISCIHQWSHWRPITVSRPRMLLDLARAPPLALRQGSASQL